MNAPFFFAADAAFRAAFPRVKGRFFLTILLLASLAALLPSLARAQPYPEIYPENRSIFGDAVSDEGFGMTVAASTDTIVVGTASNRHAYIFTRAGSDWVLQQKFTDTQPYSADDVAVDGDTLVARGTIYTRTGAGGAWTPQQSFTTWEHPATALQGDTLVVGSPFNRVSNRGSVTVYQRSGATWTQQLAFGPDGSDTYLGHSVALDGDTFIASVDNTTGAYIYVRSGGTWTRQARLALPPTFSTASGMHVALSGDTAAVGLPIHDLVIIYTRNGTTWTETQRFQGSHGTKGGPGFFGYKLVLRGDVLAAGDEESFGVYSRGPSGWRQVQSISRPDYRYEGGLALGPEGEFMVIGNPSDGTKAPGAGIAEVFSAAQPPAGNDWRDTDIGAVGVAGSSTAGDTDAQVRGSGADIWERADQFHFRGRTFTGNGAIIARVTSAGSGHPWAKVGLMFREDLSAQARNVMALVTPGAHLGTQVRSATGGDTAFQDAGWAAAPIWLMLAREGNLFASYRSDDGENWTSIGSTTLSLPASIQVGLAVSSHDNAVLNTGNFAGIEFVGGGEPPPPTPPNPPSALVASLAEPTSVRLQWTDNSADETGFVVERWRWAGDAVEAIATVAANVTEYTDAGLNQNASYTYEVRAARDGVISAPSNTYTITTGYSPAVMRGAQLGTAQANGGHSNFFSSQGTYYIDAIGADFWNQEDGGYFVHRDVTGDFDIRARIQYLGTTGTHPWAKAGLMVRESLDVRARNLFTLLTFDNAAGFQVRDTFGGATSFTSGPWVRAPHWVRLTRTGDTFRSYISPDGTTWQFLGSATVALPTSLLAGIGASSHGADKIISTTVTNLQFTP